MMEAVTEMYNTDQFQTSSQGMTLKGNTDFGNLFYFFTLVFSRMEAFSLIKSFLHFTIMLGCEKAS